MFQYGGLWNRDKLNGPGEMILTGHRFKGMFVDNLVSWVNLCFICLLVMVSLEFRFSNCRSLYPYIKYKGATVIHETRIVIPSRLLSHG